MKNSLLFLLMAWCCSGSAQDTVTKYYDTDWAPTVKERSVYYVDFVKQGTTYNTRSYFSRGNMLQGRAIYPDTVLRAPIGDQVSYYKNGKTEDSVIYKPDGSLLEAFHYYENEQLGGHFYIVETTKKQVVEGFDENGGKIKNYTLAKEAEFKGGDEAWKNYLSKNTRKDILVRGTEQQTVKVLVLFFINESGFVSGVKVQNSSGNVLVDKDAVGVITASPPWTSAIQYNKPVKAYRLQPMTYVLEPMKKK